MGKETKETCSIDKKTKATCTIDKKTKETCSRNLFNGQGN